MSRHTSELTDAQWAHIAPLLPEPKASPNGTPKPIANRLVFEGILWVLRSGTRWKDLPERYPSPSTCWRRLRAWEAQDIWLKAWRTLLSHRDEQGQLDWAETFADGSFAPAKKEGPVSVRPNAERVRSGWWWQTARVFLWENYLNSASKHEVGLIEPTLERVAVPRPGRGRPRKNPTWLIYDKAADSDPLRARLARRGD